MRAGTPAIGVTLKTSETGEVLARSNVVLEGYWEQPEETEAALGDGWFHTGDGGVIGDDGYLTIQDRKKDVIITGGENVSSIEVEDVIFSHPDVAEVAVIGVPDEKWGETIKALVVQAPRAPTLTEAELIAYCKSKVAALQGTHLGGVPRGARPDRDRQAAEVQAARAVLGGPRPPGQLTPPRIGSAGTATAVALPMPALGEVVALVEGWYPPERAEDWDAVGLVCGDPEADVRRILLAVDPVQAVADEAVAGGAPTWSSSTTRCSCEGTSSGGRDHAEGAGRAHADQRTGAGCSPPTPTPTRRRAG